MFNNKKTFKKDNTTAYKEKLKKVYEKKPKNYDAAALFRYSIWLLSKRDYSIAKMREKLLTKSEDNDLINSTLDKLIDSNYLNDNRKAQSILRQYSTKESGYKLINRLKLAGISADIIENEIEENENSQDKELIHQNCLNILTSKFKSYDNDLYMKYSRFLLTKGFEPNIVKSVIKEFKTSSSNDEY